MTCIFISKNAHREVKAYLETMGTVVEIDPHPELDVAISTHPDLQLAHIKGQLFVAPNANKSLLDWLNELRIPFQYGAASIGSPYLKEVLYNAVILADALICNVKLTDKKLLAYAQERGLEIVHVNQGYAKCSTVVVDGRGIITADHGMIRTIEAMKERKFNKMTHEINWNSDNSHCDIQLLQIQEGFVQLPNYPHGFIGGASGLVEDTLIWNGSLEGHPDAQRIRDFVQSRGIESVEFPGLNLVDIGTIIQWKGLVQANV